MTQKRWIAGFVGLGIILLAVWWGGKRQFMPESSPAFHLLGNSRDGALANLNDKSVGAVSSSRADAYLRARFPRAQIHYFDNLTDAIFALRSNKIDYIVGAYATMFCATRRYPGELSILPEPLTSERNGIGFRKGNYALRDAVNRSLAKLAATGKLRLIIEKWVNADWGHYPVIAVPKAPADAPVLRVGISADREPICFVRDDVFLGMDCELIETIAADLGRRVEYYNTSFPSLLVALKNGSVDLVISSLTRSPEREEDMDFSDVYFYNPQTVLLRTETLTAAAPEEQPEVNERGTRENRPLKGFFAEFADSFQRTFVHENRYLLILEGLRTTIVISVAAGVLGLGLSILLCMARLSERRLLRHPTHWFIQIVRGTPIAVFLMFLYYGVFSQAKIAPETVAIGCFSIYFAVTCAEIFRNGMLSLNHGELEMATAMGFSPWAKFRVLILPQLLPRTLPQFRDSFSALVKMTSIVGFIAVQDLTKMNDVIRSRTYEAFFPLVITALLYFICTYFLTIGISCWEWRLHPSNRRRRVPGVELP